MWWRWMILIAVAIVLFSAYLHYRRGLFNYGWLEKFYKFLMLKNTDEPGEQWGHFTVGALAPLVATYLFDFLPGVWWFYLICAFVIGFVKEIIEMVSDLKTKGDWDSWDSCWDMAFWTLGGLVAPLVKSF